VYARFGQELYTQETITAAAIVAAHAEQSDQRALMARVADMLPHASCTTRRRIATKLLQRLTAGAISNLEAAPLAVGRAALNGHSPHSVHKANVATAEPAKIEEDQTAAEEVGPQLPAEATLPAAVASFARLLSHIPDTQARQELVYYAAARADNLIAAIACEILYPYFIEGCIPAPYSEDEFIMANAGLLLAPEPILTTGFVADYARRAWGFESERTVGLALRILRQAGILISAPLLGARGRVAAYTLAPHNLSLPALLWSFYDEFGGDTFAPAWDQVGRSHFARLFVVPSSVVTSRLWEAERAGLVGFWSAGGSRRVALKVRETEALARLLLSGPAK
jgi:hypothetical protein